MSTVQRSNMTQTDSKGKVLREPALNLTQTAVNFKWWQLPETQMAAGIAATIKFIQDHEASRLEQLTVSSRLYGNTSSYNLVGASFSRASNASVNPTSQRIGYNVCESVIDTLVSKMAKDEILPTYVPNGGDWSVHKKAKQLTKFTQGLFYEEKVNLKVVDSFGDAAVWGDGFCYVFAKDNKCRIERVLPHELLVDCIEASVGEPTQMHRIKVTDRDTAMYNWPELEEYIAMASPAGSDIIGVNGTAADLIQINESWHLKSGDGADDGLHVISIGEGALIEDYEEDYFPFPHYRYMKRKIGWYGQGICERLQNIQGELNRSMILKQRSMWIQGSFKILLEIGSKVVTQHLNNDVGSLIFYTGTKPEYITPPPTHPQLQEWIDILINYAYQQEGMNRLSSQGQVPLGVESGKAMRSLTQITDERYTYNAKNLEAYGLEIARQAINVVKKIYKETGTYKTIFPDKHFMQTIDWKDINLDQEQYVLKALPISKLSTDMAGRIS